jgi:hypothetical protein
MVEPLKVDLPDPEHSHWSEEHKRFLTHSHVHGGPHQHVVVDGRRRVVNGPGNYSPKGSR